ncbi:hypothetical protein PV377_40830, partial [Streptomyces ipomoeae]|nr:hypothetical protein [Streptomyces ipomoeae]
MGILSRLRNAFGRSRKGHDAVPSQEATPVSSPEAEPKVPAPASEPTTTAEAEPTGSVPTPATEPVGSA